MMDDDNAEEPPALSSSRATSAPSAPPSAAFSHASSGAAPPSAAFSHSSGHAAVPAAPPSATLSDDLNSRWKKYESEMENRRSESSLSVSRSVNDADEREATRRFLRDTNLATNAGVAAVPDATSDSAAYKNYGLHETPERTGRPSISSSVAPSLVGTNPDFGSRRVYSFNKSSSYDTNELIRKYAGVSSIPRTLSSSSSASGVSVTVPPVTLSHDPRSSPRRTMSTHSASVREEALQVLDLVDEHLNTPFNVRRTESGGFRAAPTMAEVGTYRVRRTDSDAVMVEREGEDEGDGAIQPYYAKRTASGTVTTGRGGDGKARRTPSALAGLSLSENANSRNSWKAGRYSFTDPKFREDDYIADEEDDIIGQVASLDENDPNFESVDTRLPYADNPISPGGSGGFHGDYPQSVSNRPSSWSSRYSTQSPQKRILDQWDDEYANRRERQSARNMFMSTASNMRVAAGNVGDAVATQGARVFGAGFSFRQNHTFGNQQKGGTNLRTEWKDEVGEEYTIQGPRVHKTWQEVMLNKRRRRRVLLSLLCVVVACIIVGISVGSTSDTREAKQAANFPGSGLGSTVTFYATSNTPYDKGEEEQLSKELSKIPHDAEFILHLGNLQDAFVTMCPGSRNGDAASILKNAPVPLFVVPGEQDWVKCPNQAAAWTGWMDAFGTFQSYFKLPFEVKTSDKRPELFAFLQNGVMFFGLHLVSGTFEDLDAQKALNDEMKAFILSVLDQYKEQFRAVVLMGNARPGPQQMAFFDSIGDALNNLPAPVAYVHAYSGSASVEHSPFENIDVFGIEVPKGGDHPPLKITVGFGQQPFVVG